MLLVFNIVGGSRCIIHQIFTGYVQSLQLFHQLTVEFLILNNSTFYQLRHLFGTDLITNNVDGRTIQELMGHASYSMSVSYARSSKERKKDALDKRHLS
ncbi:tyrosine-type recombinase/integrase [Anaerorhabdus sp.]|uniref:tyrosine-type recombinase/integrase n=1 Tax=Anaerorhabdus sp. TaxID=1872524 RepID=UPI003FA5B564